MDPRHRIGTQYYVVRAPITLNADAMLATIPTSPQYCEFESVGSSPRAWDIFDPRTATLWTHTRSPRATNIYQNVSVVVGLPPYGDGGFSIVAFGDKVALNVNLVSRFAEQN